MPPAEALHAGSSATWLPSENRLHDFYGFGWVQTFIGDVRYAVLSLGRNPAVSLATALEDPGRCVSPLRGSAPRRCGLSTDRFGTTTASWPRLPITIGDNMTYVSFRRGVGCLVFSVNYFCRSCCLI